MKNALPIAAALVLFSLAGCTGGLKSEACVQYFAKNEACAAKAPKMKGDALRATAAVSKENFEKNSNPMAISESCKIMLQTLDSDPDCK